MIYAYFNELSLRTMTGDVLKEEEVICTFARLLKELRQLGIKKVRYDTLRCAKGVDISDALRRRGKSRSVEVQLIYSMLTRPFVAEEDEDKVFAYEKYSWIGPKSCRVECWGLATAAATGSLAVGIDYGLFKNGAYNICKVNSQVRGKADIIFDVPHLTTPDHIGLQPVVDVLKMQDDLIVPKAAAKANKVTVASHHGQKECQEMASRLMDDEYVVDVPCSLPFKPKETTFIHDIKDPNIVEIRLTNTKVGYGLRIFTSAKNKPQNHWIARHIEEKYSKRPKKTSCV